MNDIPYRCRFTTTASGLKIGVAFVSRPAPLSLDQECIQAALLEPRKARQPSLVRRLLAAFWRHSVCLQRADCRDLECPGRAIGQEREAALQLLGSLSTTTAHRSEWLHHLADLSRAIDQRRGS